MFTLGLIGTVFILKYGSILDPLRNKLRGKLKELFKCSLCLGFWVGVGWMEVYEEYWSLMTPFYSAAVCWFADGLMQFLQACDLLVMKNVNKD
ncbi:MAG: hypothetical protein EBU90_19990 [Proteobacteria bacterium]|nr:hypothetical protein [Pseudomonadota bacterium]